MSLDKSTLFGELIHTYEPRQIQVQSKPRQIDEYGFLIMSDAARRRRHSLMALSRYHFASIRGYGMVGSGTSLCKGLCANLPHEKNGRLISHKKTGYYWCMRCECLMKCARCRCCGTVGRAEPRTRKKDNEKRIE
jgi:hypothetical protein